jgi:hypothetical protein
MKNSKLLLTVCFTLLLITANAQTDTIVSFKNIVEVTGLTKAQLFLNGRHWFNKNFTSSKDVLQIIDPESGELSGKGVLKSVYFWKTTSYDVFYHFTINLKVKDGKYKYEFTDFIVDENKTPAIGEFPVLTSSNICPKNYSGRSKEMVNKMYESMKNELAKEISNLVNSLFIEMSNKSKDDF